MTGICGLWRFDGRPDAGEACARMARALRIYGPDRSGLRDDGPIALACRLARLLPEDRHDRQPLASADGRFVLVADVRLDNRPELARALGLAAERVAAMADADLLLEAWIAWGRGGIARLVGDFAFAVWDGFERRLALVRDFPGGRPLFWHRGEGRIGFASMVKGLHALPDVPVAADAATLGRHLMLLPMRGSASFFAGIHRVEPGHFVEFATDGVPRTVRWYEPPATLPDLRDPRPYLEEIRTVFDRAVADRLRGTGAVAATLSGGRDSTLVTATAAVQLAALGRRLAAYTHVPLPGVPLDQPPGRFADEGDLARLVAAAHANVDHELVTAAGRRIGDDLDRRFHDAEMPALNLCNEVWLSEIARLAGARRGTVLLTATWGNMTVGDEGLAGLNSLLYGGRPVAWARTALALLRTGGIAPASLGFLALQPLLPPAVEAWLRRLFRRPGRRLGDYTLVRPEVAEAPQPDDRPLLREAHGIFGQLARARRERMLSLFWQQELLALGAKGVLARNGVDIRDPMADRRLIDLCLALPHGLYLRDGRPRAVYHLAFADRVPTAIANNPLKGLQGGDWATRLDAARDVIVEEAARAHASPTAAALIDLDELRHLARTIPAAGEVDISAKAVRYRYRLLRTLSVAHFLRRIEGGNR